MLKFSYNNPTPLIFTSTLFLQVFRLAYCHSFHPSDYHHVKTACQEFLTAIQHYKPCTVPAETKDSPAITSTRQHDAIWTYSFIQHREVIYFLHVACKSVNNLIVIIADVKHSIASSEATMCMGTEKHLAGTLPHALQY